MNQTLMESNRKHLQWKRKKQKKWICDDTMQIIEAKRKAYRQCQESRTDARKQRECKTIRRAVKAAVNKGLREVVAGSHGGNGRLPDM